MDPPTRSTPPRRPMAFVRRVSLFRREIIESISPAALELLLGSAGRISEGQISGGRYYGSTMLTIDLDRIRGVVQDACDVATAARLAQLLAAEPRVGQLVKELALREARRIAARSLELVEAELRVRTEGTRVCVDMDVEGIFASRGTAGTAGTAGTTGTAGAAAAARDD